MWRRAAVAWVVLGVAVGAGALGVGPAGGSQATNTSIGARVDPGMEESADMPATLLPGAASGAIGTTATPESSPAGEAAPGDNQGRAPDQSSTGQPSGESQSAARLLLGVGMIIGGSVWLVRRNRRRASAELVADDRDRTLSF